MLTAFKILRPYSRRGRLIRHGERIFIHPATGLGFIEGGQLRLARILQYFRALCGEAEFPAVRCNAPWVSVVIETTGRTRGCFFHPVIGDFKDMNGVDAIRFRSELNVL
jgi:hypothetical protein